MDIFRFSDVHASPNLVLGQVINNLKRKMWVERYRTAGEFSLVASADVGMRDILPIGTIISHTDTTELMVVENHEISYDRGKESEITISGRGFESLFEQRIVGSNKNYPTDSTPSDYNLAANYTWIQAVQMLSDHILAANLIDDDNEIPFVVVSSTVVGVGDSEARVIKKGDLSKALTDLLSIDDLGIKVIRPGPWNPAGAGNASSSIVIHKGVDRSASVIFSYDSGEVVTADYLWSNKKLKNAALVVGRFTEAVVIPSGATKYDRRWMIIDASSMDQALPEAPTGVTRDNWIALFQQVGTASLASQKDVALTKAEIAREATKALYRTDYDVGDVITVHGDYNEVSTMRVNEYVEIEDENGSSGYPTLTSVD